MARVSQICAIVLLLVISLNAIVPAKCASIMLNVRIAAKYYFYRKYNYAKAFFIII